MTTGGQLEETRNGSTEATTSSAAEETLDQDHQPLSQVRSILWSSV